jgi:4-amino-4-deoxy-L-arabinose transferase-like glycosyltransferase
MTPRRSGPGAGAAVLVAALFFAVIAPTLDWLEFSGGSENLVVGAVVEMERGGPVLVPNLQGEPRVKKPPLTTWVASLGVRDSTARDLSSPDRATRDAAFKRLAFEIRWTSLLAACLLLLAVYALGRSIGGARVGLVAALVAGSTLMFLRFGRAATTDVHLALWVTLANACFAAALLRGRRWLGALGGGAALGLAFMSKGPVALVQSVLPLLLFAAWTAWDRPGSAARGTEQGPAAPPRDAQQAANASRVVLLLTGLLVFLLVALPWFVAVAARRPGVLREWFSEVSRADATDLPPDPWYVYLVLFFYVAPWVAWFVAGAVMGVARAFRVRPRESSGSSAPAGGFPVMPEEWNAGTPTPAVPAPGAARPPGSIVLSLLLTFVPVLVMMLFKDKNERYLFPLVGPAAVLAAQAIVGWVEAGRPRGVGAAAVRFAHWATLFLFAVGAPVGAALLKAVDGGPWITPLTAAVFTAIGVAVLLAGLLLDRARPYAMVGAAVSLMLLVQFPILMGYRNDRQGRAELKPLADAIWAAAPDADVYELDVAGRTRTRYDLPIYLNRVTHKTADPLTLVQDARPIALVYFGSRKAPEPVLPPPWRAIGEGPDGKSKWRLYVLPAR